MELDKRERWVSKDGEVFYGTAEQLIKEKNLMLPRYTDGSIINAGWVHIYYIKYWGYPLQIDSGCIYSKAQIKYLKPIFEKYKELISSTTIALWDFVTKGERI